MLRTRISVGSTPINGSNVLPAGGPGWFPPKELCGSSTLPRESNHADIVLMAARVFGKDEVMVRFHVLAPIAEQALMVMRAACTREKTVQVGRLAPIRCTSIHGDARRSYR